MTSRLVSDTRSRRPWLAVAVALAVLFGVCSPIAFTGIGAAAAAEPGVPNEPAVLYTEDFQQGSGTTLLPDYVSADGQTYTADSYWLRTQRCNGIILSWSVGAWPGSEYCNNQPNNWNGVRAQAAALGRLENPATADANRAMSEFTSGSADSNVANTSDGAIPVGTQFATVGQIPLAASNRFVTFSVDASAANCHLAQPQLQFNLRAADGSLTPVPGGVLNPCSDSRKTDANVHGFNISYGSFPARGSFLFSGSSLGIVLQNQAKHTYGNDGAIDNIRVLDVTPRLDIGFDPGRVRADQTSRLTYTITNTSDVAEKNGWAFTNTLPAGLVLADDPAVESTCDADVTATGGAGQVGLTAGVLASGEASCTVTVSVRSTEFTADEAPTERTYEDCAADVSNVVGLDLPECTEVTFYSEAGLTMTKTASITDPSAFVVGAPVEYSFLVENTGTVNLSSVQIAEGEFTGSGTLSPATCPTAPIAPGKNATCTATYTVTQADIDRGSISNTAHATAVVPGGGPIESEDSTALSPITQTPGLTVEKTASITEPDDFVLGAKLDYTFTVGNPGNVTLSDVTIAEGEFTGSGSLSDVTCPATSLAPKASMDCTATYTVTQADINAGSISNTAKATGTGPTGPVESDDSTAISPITQTPVLTVEKTASITDPAAFVVGAELSYNFAVVNDGNVDLTDVTIAEGEFTGSGALSDVTCPATSLAPKASMDCTATYTVTQADINAGSISNTAKATGTGPTGPVESDDSTAISPITQTPVLTIEKTASITDPSAFVVGAEFSYNFAVTNDGNVDLTDVKVAEGEFTGSGALSDVTCPATSLAPKASMDCTATYTVTQADINAGSISNTAKATGTGPTGPVESDDSTAISPITQTPVLTVEKTASITDPAAFVVGAELSYTFAVTNDGNVDLTDVKVAEGEFTGSGALSDVTCPATSLAPKASMDCTATYTVTQADINAGSISNTAKATGTGPTGPVESDDSTAISPITQTPVLTVEKTASITDPAAFVVGAELSYTFAVVNDGNVDLTDVTVAEGEFTGSGALSDVTCPATSLAPKASMDCTATYTVTQADINAGSISNTAKATGTGPTGPVESDDSTAISPITQTPVLTVEKTASITDPAAFVVGAELTYTFAVSNDGNVDLTDVKVAEGEFTGSGALSDVTCPATSLAPKASMDCTATYTVTQADINAGSISNTAKATGTGPTGPVESDDSTAISPITQTPVLTVEKTASITDPAAFVVGAELTYNFAVVNDGNVDLTDVKIAEGEFTGSGSLSDVTCPATSLAPKASMDCTATYTVTQADINAGSISNTAKATGTGPTGPVESDDSTAISPITQTQGLTIVKTAAPTDPTLVVAGSVVDYSFLVSNTGNIDLTDVRVVEGDFTGSGSVSDVVCPATTLAPKTDMTCTATYTVTDADVAQGSITNTATATAVGPDGAPIESDGSTAVVPTAPIVTPEPTDTPGTPGATPPPPGGQLPTTGADAGTITGLLVAIAVAIAGGLAATVIGRARRANGRRDA